MSSSLDAAAAPVQLRSFRFPGARADSTTPAPSSLPHARSLSAAPTLCAALHRPARSLSYTNTPAPFLLQHHTAVLRTNVRSWHRLPSSRPPPVRTNSARSLRPLSLVGSPRRFSLANDACTLAEPRADRPCSTATTPRSPALASPSPRSAFSPGMVVDLEELLNDTKSPAPSSSFSPPSPFTPHNFSGPESPEVETLPPSALPSRPVFRRQSSQFSVEQLPSSPLPSEIESIQRASHCVRTRRGQSVSSSPPIVIMLRTSSGMPASDSLSSIASTSTLYADAPEYSVSFAPLEPARPRAHTDGSTSRSPRGQAASSSRLLVDDTGSSTETDRTPTVASQAAFHTPKRQTGRSHRRMLSDTDAMLARAASASIVATAASAAPSAAAAARPGHARRRSRTLFEAKVKAQASRRRTRELSSSFSSLDGADPHTPSPRPARRSESARQPSLRPSSAEKPEHIGVSPEFKDDDASLYAAISFIDGGYNAGSPLGGSDTSPGSSQGSTSWIDTPKGSNFDSPLSPFDEAHRATSHLADELEVWSSSDDDDDAAVGTHTAASSCRKPRGARETFSTPDASPMLSLASARQTVVLQASALSLRLKSAERLSSLTHGKLVQQEALQQAVQSKQPTPKQPRRAGRQLPPQRDGQSLTGQPLPPLPALPAMEMQESPKGTLSSDQPTFAAAHQTLATGPRMASAEARARGSSSTPGASAWSFASTAAGIMCIPGDEAAMIQRDAMGLGISNSLSTPSPSPSKPARPERSLRRPSATNLTALTPTPASTALLKPQAAPAPPKKRSSRSPGSRRRHTGPRLDAALPKTPARMASLEHCVAAPSARKQLTAPPPARPLLGAWMSEPSPPQLGAASAFQLVTVPPTPDPTAPDVFESPRSAPRAPSPAPSLDKSLPTLPSEATATGTSFASSASVASFVARVAQQAGADAAAAVGTSPLRPQASGGGLRARLTAKLRGSTSSLTLRSDFAQAAAGVGGPLGSARSERSGSEPEEIVAFSPTGPRPSLPLALERSSMWSGSVGRASFSHVRRSNGSVASLGSVISAEAEAEEDAAFARSASSMASSRRMSPFMRRRSERRSEASSSDAGSGPYLPRTSTSLFRASETWSRSTASMERHGSASSAVSSASSTDSYSLPPPMVRSDSSATTTTVSSFSDSDDDDEELHELAAHGARVDSLRGSLRRTPSRLGLNALPWPRARKASLDVAEQHQPQMQPYAPPHPPLKSATRRSSLFGMNVWA